MSPVYVTNIHKISDFVFLHKSTNKNALAYHGEGVATLWLVDAKLNKRQGG